MQSELLAANPLTKIRIAGINQIGAESGIDTMCSGRDIPLLQDTLDDHVWAQWQVRYRDVYILDEENRLIDVYNLTDNSLSYPENYDELKQKLLDAAGE